MDKQAAELRIKELREARKKAAEQSERWTDKLKVIDGQLAERGIDLAQSDKPKMKLPIYTPEEVEERLKRRKDPPVNIDELEAARRHVYQKEANELADLLEDDSEAKQD